uniref:Exonuclease domain-containing protein n=1 Tax=Setaria italica TaxID=4555 RepID=K3Y242_SETIT
MALARVPPSSAARLLPSSLLQSFLRPFSSSASPLRSSRRRSSPIAAAFSHAVREGQVMEAPIPISRRPWKPTCLYYTQGKCTMMNDAMHLEKFSHNLMMDLPVNASAADKVKPQKLDYLLILDLEGKVEILEFPVVMIDAQSMEFIDSFHRFVRPTAMSEQRITEYIEGKYGKFGVDRYVQHIPLLCCSIQFDLYDLNQFQE